jgi:sec-independent protein translocase protein TatB
MFGIGMPELILIAVVALIVLGPKRLPDLAKSMGRAVREFRKATSELKETLQVDSEFTEVKKAFQDFQSDVNQSLDPKEQPKEPPAAEAPPATAPQLPAAEEPSTTDKLDALNAAFDKWNAGASPHSPESGEAPASPEAPAPAPEKPKST